MRGRVTVALLVLVFAVGCVVPLDPPPTDSAPADGPPQAGGTLRLSAPDEPRTLDPAIGYDVASWSFELAIFNMLVDYDDGTGIVPSLAERWTVSADGRRYQFDLRPNVRFSTGRAMTSADVRYSIERLLSPTLHSQGAEFLAGLVGAEAYTARQSDHVVGITTPDARTAVFEINPPDPLFLHKLAMPFAAVVDRETVERVGDQAFRQHPVGTGPFLLKEWRYGQSLRLERNPHYFRPGLPRLDAVELTIGVSDQLAWFKYQRGELDLAGIPSAEFVRVMADQRYTPLITERATLRTQYLGINCAVPPFDRPAVRRALNLAINPDRLLELADGRGVVARTILPPAMPGYRAGNRAYRHDPVRARRLLAEAGVPAFDTTLWTSADDGPLRLGQSIQRDLADVGITVRIKPVTFPALIEAVRNPRQVALFMLGWEADFPDPSNFLTVLLHGRNRGANNNTAFADPVVDALLDRADASSDPQRRMRYFQRAERRIMDAAPWVPLFHPTSFAVRHPRVRSYRLHPLRPARLDEVWLAG
jgi:oligopeptide transport system substrate-binding protein